MFTVGYDALLVQFEENFLLIQTQVFLSLDQFGRLQIEADSVLEEAFASSDRRSTSLKTVSLLTSPLTSDPFQISLGGCCKDEFVSKGETSDSKESHLSI